MYRSHRLDLLIGLAVWIAGVALATKFGTLVSFVSSVALIAFGAWIALSSLLEIGTGYAHARGQRNGHEHAHDETAGSGTSDHSGHTDGKAMPDFDERAIEPDDRLYVAARPA